MCFLLAINQWLYCGIPTHKKGKSMEENLNQEIQNTTTTDDDFSIDEIQAEIDEETSLAEGEENKGGVNPEGEQTSDPFMHITYNGVEEALTREQAIELAQKGRNYDKLLQRNQQLANDPALLKLNEMASRAGTTPENYLNQLSSFQRTNDINKLATKLKEQYPNTDDKLLLDYAERIYTENVNKLHEQEMARQQQMHDATQQQLINDIQYMQKYHPEVDLEHLPAEVIQMMQNGTNLVQAYSVYENRILKNKLSAFEKNSHNAKKSVGNIAVDTPQEINDPFLQGFLGK